jgi:hypothetical protein
MTTRMRREHEAGRMRAIIDVMAARMGYHRAPQPHSGNVERATSEAHPVPPHLAHQTSFDYARAVCGRDWVFFYEDEDSFMWAVGKHGWMPVTLASFVLGGAEYDGVSLFSTAVADRLWLETSTQSHSSWLLANRRALSQVAGVRRDESAGPARAGSELTEANLFEGIDPAMISHELRTMWRRFHPKSSVTILATSEAHVSLLELPFMKSVGTSIDAALQQLMSYTATWLEARGFHIDYQDMLVKVDGYEPLFHRDDDPGAF